MAEKIVSPAVFTRENDLSYISQGIGEIGAVVIGPFKKGPAFLPTVVNTQSEFENIFGTPDGAFYTGYTVQNYLREAGTVTIVKVGHTEGHTQELPIGIGVSGGKLISVINSSVSGDISTGFTDTVITANPSSSLFNISGSDIGVEVSASIQPTDSNNIEVIFGKTPFGTKNGYSYTYFENSAIEQLDEIASGEEVELVTLGAQVFEYENSYASTPWVLSQDDGSGNRSQLFRIHTLSDGTDTNTEYKVSIYNVKAGKNGKWGTFSLMLRKYDDTDTRKSIVETYSGLTLDEDSPNHIARIIGDIHKKFDVNIDKFIESGDWKNYSDRIRVEVKSSTLYPKSTIPFAHEAYTNPIFVGGDETIVPNIIYTTGSADNTGTDTATYSGIDFNISDNLEYNKPIPTGATIGANVDFGFDTVEFGFEPTGSIVADVNKRQFTLSFQGGYDGVAPNVPIKLGSEIDASNSQGFDLSTSLAEGSIAYQRAIDSIASPDEYDVNMVVAPGIIRRFHPGIFDNITAMAESREDVFFIGDVVGVNGKIGEAITQGEAVDSNYVGTYYPWVKIVDANTNKLTSVPPSVLMPGIYASNDAIAAEWFAPAGLNRGGIVGAVSVLNRLTHAERDELYEGKINPIATFPGQGIVAFGQKTLQERASALDRINVRRLLIKVKKFIASTSRYLIFEQNTASTRNKFLNTVNPYLEGIQQRQGLYTFKVVMDETNNTPDIIDRNFLVGQIYLQPTKTAEFIVLDFNILPTGATFSG